MSSDDEAMQRYLETYKEILEEHGVSACPYNMTAGQIIIEACAMLEKTAPSKNAKYALRILYSETLGAPAMFMGVYDELSGDFNPVAMVMTSEGVGTLALHCGSPWCSHETCEVIPDGLRRTASEPDTTERPMTVEEVTATNAAFAPLADMIDSELPKFEDLARFYEVRDDEKGG